MARRSSLTKSVFRISHGGSDRPLSSGRGVRGRQVRKLPGRGFHRNLGGWYKVLATRGRRAGGNRPDAVSLQPAYCVHLAHRDPSNVARPRPTSERRPAAISVCTWLRAYQSDRRLRMAQRRQGCRRKSSGRCDRCQRLSVLYFPFSEATPCPCSCQDFRPRLVDASCRRACYRAKIR